jgi:peptidoglycan hydrolase-like protein with peptidoglycan-binding domain
VPGAGKTSNLSLAGTKPLAGGPKGGTPVAHSQIDRYSDGVKQMQLKMQAAGIDPGPIDGLKGPLTRNAMRQYEEKLGKSAAAEFGVNPDWAEIAGSDKGSATRSSGAAPGNDAPSDAGGRVQYNGKMATVQGKQMTPATAAAFQQMYEAAKRDGVTLNVNSAFRDPAYQAKLFKQAVAKYGSESAARKWVAPPGRSEHQTGTALDMGMGNGRVYSWLRQNAGKFGLKQSYSWEPWHYRYWGK